MKAIFLWLFFFGQRLRLGSSNAQWGLQVLTSKAGCELVSKVGNEAVVASISDFFRGKVPFPRIPVNL